MNTDTVVSYIFLCVISAATPGPGTLAVVAQSIQNGFRHTLPLIIGIQLGLLSVAIAAISGLAVVFKASTTLYYLVQYAGLSYLGYLGVMSLIASYHNYKINESALSNFSFKQGVIISSFNPKTLLFFSSIFPMFINVENAYWVQALWLVVILLFSTFLVHLFYSLIMEKISWVLFEYSRLFHFSVGVSFISLAIVMA
ncbi:LysE family translocator [Endozoicomonas sp. SM1973]|uniref:LysE family translocator n=1 Tax=Spartinivicinus marinus TaxID=2994442 RepID=A0A853I099_9GAMM|nr:LysE family translocator [Spartinivicinus marinus]MCX4028486.1 LysE family translocator [Spartinivicinus marinus]NYZ67400.1 LysE family translocator [Spartinivicinus marinus]